MATLPFGHHFPGQHPTAQAHSGVHRESQIPPQCRKEHPQFQTHRKRWIDMLTERLKQEGKIVKRSRILSDGAILDWVRQDDSESLNTQRRKQSPRGTAPATMSSGYTEKSPKYTVATVGRSALNPVDLTLHDDDEKDRNSPFLEGKTPDYTNLEYEMISDREDGRVDPSRSVYTRPQVSNVRERSPPSAPRIMRGLPSRSPFAPPNSRSRESGTRIRPHPLPPKPNFTFDYLSRSLPLPDARQPTTQITHPSQRPVRKPENRAPGRRYREHTRTPERRGIYPIESSSRRNRMASPQRRKVVDRLRDRNRGVVESSKTSTGHRRFSPTPSPRLETSALVPAAPNEIVYSVPVPEMFREPERMDFEDIPGFDDYESWTAPQVAALEDSPAPNSFDLDDPATPRRQIPPMAENGGYLFAITPSPTPYSVPMEEESSDDEDTADEMEIEPLRSSESKHSIEVPSEASRLLASINADVARGVLRPDEFTSNETATPSVGHSRRLPAPVLQPQPRARVVEKPLSRSRPPLSASSKRPSSRVSNKTSRIDFDVAKTVLLPRPEFARARRLLAPRSHPLVWVSMPGDIQFIEPNSRSRVESWSLPAPQRLRSSEERKYVVSDACVLGDSRVVIVHESGPNPVSILTMSQNIEDIPKRYNISNILVPTGGLQRRGGITSVCAVDQSLFITGGADKRVLLWKVSMPTAQRAPTSTLKPLKVTHLAAVRALAYEPQKKWLISAAGAKLAITELMSEKEIVPAKRQKWASNEVFNIHISEQNRDLILLETGDLDRQVRIYDTRSLQNTDNAPLALIGCTETTSISQFLRGDWSNSLVVRPSGSNKVRVWDIRFASEPLCVHSVPHVVTHTIFTNGGKTIAATGGHMVSFLDARV